MRGAAVFTHDVELPHMLHGAILRSPHAHARIRAIDTAAARSLPGIHAVITAADFPGSATCIWACAMPTAIRWRWDKVRFYGEEVAAVAADSAALARQALALIAVDYEPLPAALTPEAALRPGAPEVHDGALTTAGRNIAIRFACDYGDVAGAFARAAHVFEDEFAHGIVVPACMETNGTVARFDPATGELTLTRDAGAVLRAQGSRARAGPGHRARAHPWRRGRRRLRGQVQGVRAGSDRGAAVHRDRAAGEDLPGPARGVHQRQDRSRQAHPHPHRGGCRRRHPRALGVAADRQRRLHRLRPDVRRRLTPAHRVPLSRADRALRLRPRLHQQGPRRAIPWDGRAADHLGDREPDGRDRGESSPAIRWSTGWPRPTGPAM
ncbi:MAG: molybdopterin-dependent oxidoreductase [Betaproteobacteria bacterium]|nr:molybdopterin-dependent oxidoreductase [Betaproteobacteria bacterium]